MFFNKKIDSDKIYHINPYHLDNTFVKLLHLLTNEDIYITLEQKRFIYDKLNEVVYYIENLNKGSEENEKNINN